MLKSFYKFNESNDEWLVKCLSEQDREDWLDNHYPNKNITQSEVNMFCDFIESFDEPMFQKHNRFPKPVFDEDDGGTITYYFATGSYIYFGKYDDDWYFIQSNIIRPTRYFIIDGKDGFEKFKSLMFKMREGTTDKDYNINESQLYEPLKTDAEYQELLDGHIRFSDSDKRKIIDIFNKSGIDYKISYKGSLKREVIEAYYNEKQRMIITKVSDDYFVVNLPHDYYKYKCDTIDGVIELIKSYLD